MSLPVRYEIEHVSRYTYTSPVRNCVMSVGLQPQNDERQQLLRFDLTTDPPAPHNAEADAFGNIRHVLNVHRWHEGLVISAHSIIVMLPAEALPEAQGMEAWTELRSSSDSFDDWDYTHPTPLTQPSAALAGFIRSKELETPSGDPLSALRALMGVVHDSFAYVPGSTSVASPIDHLLTTGEGVCQDYAHLMLAVTRTWGVPSRYVSGYVDTGRGQDSDARTASHAWVECRLPEIGWVGFDPTNHCMADQRHIRVGTGRDYQDVAPTRGVLQGGGETELAVEVRVRVLP